MHEALAKFLSDFRQTAPAIVDAYFIVDQELAIVEFNRTFFAMLPRQVARGLKGKKSSDVLKLEIGDEDIVRQSWRENRHVRLDEIHGSIVGDPDKRELRLIVSVAPIVDSGDENVGALVILRDVTDEAEVQVKYQDMLESEARERERLATQIRTRTVELLETNKLLLTSQKELLAYKKGLLV